MTVRLDYPLPLQGELQLMGLIASESLGRFCPLDMFYITFEKQELSVMMSFHFNERMEVWLMFKQATKMENVNIFDQEISAEVC